MIRTIFPNNITSSGFIQEADSQMKVNYGDKSNRWFQVLQFNISHQLNG